MGLSTYTPTGWAQPWLVKVTIEFVGGESRRCDVLRVCRRFSGVGRLQVDVAMLDNGSVRGDLHAQQHPGEARERALTPARIFGFEISSCSVDA